MCVFVIVWYDVKGIGVVLLCVSWGCYGGGYVWNVGGGIDVCGGDVYVVVLVIDYGGYFVFDEVIGD